MQGKSFQRLALDDFSVSPLFDHQRLAKIIKDSLEIDASLFDLPMDIVAFSKSNQVTVMIQGDRYRLEFEPLQLTKLETPVTSQQAFSISPNGQWKAYTKDYNLYIENLETKETRQISHHGKKGYEYATHYGWDEIIYDENGERPDRFFVNWSEDSKYIYTYIIDLSNAEKMHLLDWSQDDRFRPRLLSYYRGSPGDTTMVYQESVIFNVETGKEIKFGFPPSTHINTVQRRWSKKSGVVYLYRQDRGYQNVQINELDLVSLRMRQLYSESSETNIDHFEYRLAEDKNKLFVLSEQSGWRQIHSVDLTTLEKKHLGAGEYYVHRIEWIDEVNEKIYFTASGKNNTNPYWHQFYVMNFDGTELKVLTSEFQHHQISISPDKKYFVDNQSTLDSPTVTLLRKMSDGRILRTVSKADVRLLENWKAPETFTCLARDGKTTIYAAVWKPTHFDPKKKYPVIEYSYTGPHTQVYPASFRSGFGTGLQAFAELGFIAIRIDGLGSSGRSKAFHDYSYKNLGGNLEDHIIMMKSIAQDNPWFDISRVGIFGHSAGGYDAGRALLAYPDFYDVGVASSADHDHRMEKAWWPEMYMGWPVDSSYHQQSNITNAGNLKGKLLITHGGIDENVNPSATFKLAEALINHDKAFDLFIFPGQRHGYKGASKNYFTKLRWNYFIEHLLNGETRWDINFEWEKID